MQRHLVQRRQGAVGCRKEGEADGPKVRPHELRVACKQRVAITMHAVHKVLREQPVDNGVALHRVFANDSNSSISVSGVDHNKANHYLLLPPLHLSWGEYTAALRCCFGVHARRIHPGRER